jgi:hypothetical protein
MVRTAKAPLTKLKQRFTDRFEQKSQDNFLVGENQPIQFMRQGKNQMKVSHRQKLGSLFFQPPGFSHTLAFRAVAVTAGIVSWTLKAARIAAIQMPAQFLGPADRDGPDHFVFTG